MTKKATKPDPGALTLKATNDEEMNRAVNISRKVATDAHCHSGAAMRPWLVHAFGEVDLTELVVKLRLQTDALKRGDMGDIEAMLFNQALTLQTMFTALSRRAASNAGEYIGVTDTYLRLAFKAQSQCRSTLETLAEIKSPRPATFVRQANIANGPQQVNNGNAAPMPDSARAPARGISENQPNELLTDERATHDNPMDTRGKTTTGRSNSRVEAVGTLHRAANGKR